MENLYNMYNVHNSLMQNMFTMDRTVFLKLENRTTRTLYIVLVHSKHHVQYKKVQCKYFCLQDLYTIVESDRQNTELQRTVQTVQ